MAIRAPDGANKEISAVPHHPQSKGQEGISLQQPFLFLDVLSGDGKFFGTLLLRIGVHCSPARICSNIC